jgi:hypothetical protein
MRLNRWVEMARRHWKKYRPKMYNELEQSGKLEDSLDRAAERTQNESIHSVQNGMNPFEAESEAEKNNLLLPSEEDAAELGADPNRLPDPASLITTPGISRRKQSAKRSQKQDGPRPN